MAQRQALEEARRERDHALALAEQSRLERRGLDREIVELRATLQEAERQLANVRQTFMYRIGEAIVSARTWKGAKELPGRLLLLRRAFLEKKRAEGATVEGTQIAARLRYVDEAMRMLARGGVEAAKDYLDTLPAAHAAERARATIEIAQAVRLDDPGAAADLALAAARLNPREMRIRNLVLNLFEDGAVRVPVAIMELAPDLFHQPADRRRRDAILACLDQLDRPFVAPARGEVVRQGRAFVGVSNRSAPHDVGPASWRFRSTLEAVAAGQPAIWMTAPGYRYPIGHEATFVERVGSMSIQRLPPALAHRSALGSFIEEVADLFEAAFIDADASDVQVDAGDPLLAAAALAAARRTGARFVADVGVLPDGSGGASERAEAVRALFREVISAADSVVVRSDPLGRAVAQLTGRQDTVLQRDTLPREMLAADSGRVVQLARELEIEERVVIGVLESLDGDEGLADLVRALPAVLERLPHAVVFFAGEGMNAQALRLLAAHLGVGEKVVFQAPAAQYAMADVLALMDVVVFPKRRIGGADTAPFLLQLAMASGRPVIATDHVWSRDLIDDGETGRLTRIGDTESMSSTIVASIADGELRGRLVAAARDAMARHSALGTSANHLDSSLNLDDQPAVA